MAKAAFEMAFSDLSAKEEGVSLSKFLLGTKSKVESGVSVGIQKDAKRLVEAVSDYLDQGYRRIKIKIKPGNDLDEVSILRQHFRHHVDGRRQRRLQEHRLSNLGGTGPIRASHARTAFRLGRPGRPREPSESHDYADLSRRECR